MSFGVDAADPYHPTNSSGVFVLNGTGMEMLPDLTVRRDPARNGVAETFAGRSDLGFDPGAHQRRLCERDDS